MELMELLYRIMEELSKEGVPIVFKGAMVLNLITQTNNPSMVERGTRDIDGDWTGDGPTMQQMESVLRQAVKNVDALLDVRISREYGEKKSAGFKIIDSREEKIASIDLSVRSNCYSVPYTSFVSGITITGASLTKMLSDKLYAISGESICRRIKDLLDIYVISFIAEFQTSEIYKIWERTERTPGDFSQFRVQMKELSEAYEKMKGIKNKPEFLELYTRLSAFLNPFYELEKKPEMVWKGNFWKDISLPEIFA